MIGPPTSESLTLNQLVDGLGKHPDAQFRIGEQHADLGCVDQVLQIVVGVGNVVEIAFQLGVDGLKLLVDRLQLFLARLELLGRRALFLVDFSCSALIPLSGREALMQFIDE